MITAMTRYVVGDSVPEIEQKPYNGHWAEVILHTEKDGIFDHLEIERDIVTEIVEEDLWVCKGERVKAFNGANDSIGTLVLRLNNDKVMEEFVKKVHEWVRVAFKNA